MGTTTARFPSILSVLIFASSVLACDKKSREDAWQRGNMAGLEKDIRAVVTKNGIAAPTDFKCFMSKTTRDGACSFSASGAEIDAFEKALVMSADEKTMHPPNPNVCPADVFGSPAAKMTRSMDHAKVGYDYVYLSRLPDNRVCVQIRCGWG